MIRKAVLSLLLLAIASTASAAGATPSQVSIALGKDSTPYYFTGKNGAPQGLLVDLWRLWSQKTGVKVRFVSADFADTLTLVGDGKADIHAGCFKSPERDRYLDFVTPVCQVATNVFVHRNVYGIKDLEDLRGLRIGVIKGDYVLEYLKENLPSASLSVYPNNLALFRAVAEGDLLAFVKDTAIGLAMLSQRELLPNFRFDIEHPLYTRPWYAAVRQGDKRLPDLIRKGFENISPAERAALELRWIKTTSFKVADRLVITCPKDRAPFSMLSRSGRPAGLLVDIWRLWAKKVDKEVDFRFSSWDETLKDIKHNKADIHSGIPEAADDKAYLDFSHPFYEICYGFFFNPQRIQLNSPKDLAGHWVGLVENAGGQKYLEQNFPGIKTAAYPDMDTMLQAAVFGKLQAFFVSPPVALTALDHFGERGNFRLLKGPSFTNQISAGVRKGDAELLALIEAGFKAISPKEFAEIEQQWISSAEMRFFNDSRRALRLTTEEKAWLAKHNVILLGGISDWAPLDFADETGVHQGISEDYLRLLGKRLGIRFEVVTSFPWDEMLTKAKNKELDGVACIVKNEYREGFFGFSKPYFSCPYIIYTRRDYPKLKSIEDLEGKTIALEKGFYLQSLLEEHHPDINLLLLPDTIAALKAVSEGRAEAYIGNMMVANHLLNQEGISNLKVAVTSPWPISQLRVAVRKDWPILVNLLDKALDTITAEEQQKINQHWLKLSETAGYVDTLLALTPKERQWLEEHKNIRLGVDPGWPPFEFIEADKTYAGMASDYVRLLEKKLGISMKPVPDLSWGQAIAKAQAGEIDVFPCITKSPERSKFLNFTEPYLSFPMVIVTRIDAPFIAGLQDLRGKTAAVGKGYVSEEILSKKHPGIKLKTVSDVKNGLGMLSQGNVDAFVGNLGSVTYFAREAGLSNIKIAASTPYSFSLAIGVRKDWPEMVGILEKGMAAISQQQRNEIHNAWISMRFEHGVDWPYVWRLVIIIILVCLAIFTIFIFWNTRLQREVRQRKEAEQALAKSEAHLRSLVESSADAIVDMDLERRLIDCNRAFSDLFGYDKSEVMNKSILMIHRDLDAFVDMGDLAYPIVKQKGSWRGEWLYRHKNGGDAPMETVISAYRGPDGAIEGYSAIIRDISERKKAEEALRNSRRRLAEIIEFLPDATLVIDYEGKVVAWNQAMEELSGVKAEDILGKGDYLYALPFYGKKRPMLIDLVLRWDHKLAATYLSIKRVGESLYADSFQPKLGKDGIYLSSVARVLYDSEGREAGAIESIRDVTEQKLAELALGKFAQELEQKVTERTMELQSAVEALQAEVLERQQAEMSLRESEEEHRALLEASPNCVIAYDTDGSASYVNAAFTRIFGWEPEEVIGRRIDFVPEERREETQAAIAAVHSAENGLYSYESRRLTKSGKIIDVSINAALFRDPNGEPMGMIVNLADISERKLAEEELRIYRETLENLVEARTMELEVAMNRAQESDRLKSAFLASMSHELRTPLNSIIGFTGIILQGLVGPLNEEQAKQMNMVKRSANHLLSLINDVLDISKIEAGQLTVGSEDFDLREAIASVEQTLRPTAESKGLELVCDISPQIGHVVSDRRRVEQILINLVNNSIKFTEHGGVYLTSRVKDGYIQTEVRDTGIGIAIADQDKLFEAFQQIDTGLTRRYEGTGLGLNICKKLVELLGGEIWMTSEGEGGGSTFSFTLPLTDGE